MFRSKFISALLLLGSLILSALSARAVDTSTYESPKNFNRLSLFSGGFNLGKSGGGGGELPGYEFVSRSGFAVRAVPLSGYYWQKNRDELIETTYYYYSAHSTIEKAMPYSYTETEGGTVQDSAFNWAPVWIRYYLLQWPNRVWPYVGAALNYHEFTRGHYFESDETFSGVRPAAEIGLDFGGRMPRGSVNLKYFPGSGEKGDDAMIVLSAAMALGW